MSDTLSHMTLQRRGKGTAVVCKVCAHATAYIQNGFLILTDRHGSQVHTNLLTADDLEKLAQQVRDSAILQSDKVA